MTDQPDFDPFALLDALERHAVRYVLVGGWAALQHGAGRVTHDLDICVEHTESNLTALANALREVHAGLRISDTEMVPVPLLDATLLSRIERGTWRTTAGDLDALKDISRTVSERSAYAELAAAATQHTIAGHRVLIASLDDIIASKEIANRPKDHEALPELYRLRDRLARQVEPKPPIAEDE